MKLAITTAILSVLVATTTAESLRHLENPDNNGKDPKDPKDKKDKLSGEKCRELHPNCGTCTPDFKSCEVCADYSDQGGFEFFNVDGVCVLPINFDDLRGGGVPDGYRGLNYENVFLIDATTYPIRHSGYVNGNTSPPKIAYNAAGDPASLLAPDGETFSVRSLQATPAWNNDLQVVFEGYNGGVRVASYYIVLQGPTVPELIDLDGFENLTELYIVTSGGTDAITGGTGTQVAWDDILIY
jgi:hypothetical protein